MVSYFSEKMKFINPKNDDIMYRCCFKDDCDTVTVLWLPVYQVLVTAHSCIKAARSNHFQASDWSMATDKTILLVDANVLCWLRRVGWCCVSVLPLHCGQESRYGRTMVKTHFILKLYHHHYEVRSVHTTDKAFIMDDNDNNENDEMLEILKISRMGLYDVV